MTKPIEVLMVEDNPGDVVLFREAVAKAGLRYDIAVVQDGVEAAERLRGTDANARATPPDLVVLDLKLPRRSGRELLGDMTRDPRMKPPLLVVLSSSQSELELVRASVPGDQVCMTKPGTFQGFVELVETIERLRLVAEEGVENK